MAKLFIGMPVYNGEKFLEIAVESLRNQSYQDWELLISDNSSTDKSSSIAKKFTEIDKRIKYIRQDQNIGALLNFKYLLDKADSEFFMWASSDDEWHPEFIASGIEHLEKKPDCGLAFCNIENIDSFGRPIKSYPSFSRFNSSSDKAADVVTYLIDPEVLGKANLIYGIYRTQLCRSAWMISPLPNGGAVWGADCIFVLAVIKLTRVLIEDRVLFLKRIASGDDHIDKVPQIISVDEPWKHVFALDSADEYKNEIIKVFQGDAIQNLVCDIMQLRKRLAENIHAVSSFKTENRILKEQLEASQNLNKFLEEKMRRLTETVIFKAYRSIRNLFIYD